MHKVLVPYFLALFITPSTHSLEGTLLVCWSYLILFVISFSLLQREMRHKFHFSISTQWWSLFNPLIPISLNWFRAKENFETSQYLFLYPFILVEEIVISNKHESLNIVCDSGFQTLLVCNISFALLSLFTDFCSLYFYEYQISQIPEFLH